MRILLGLICLLLGTVTMAQVPNTFQSGQTASAAAVNENFNAVDNAVNDNAQRISTVESQLLRVVDFSGDVTVIIDEPGYYVLDRDWVVDPGGESLEIVADDVTLDFRGYHLLIGIGGIRISGNGVTMRNGSVSGDASFVVRTEGADTLIEGMRIEGGIDVVYLRGLRGTIRNSWLRNTDEGAAIIASTGSTIQANQIRAAHTAVRIEGTTDVRVLDNTIHCGHEECIYITGSDNILARNTIVGLLSSCAFCVLGDRNLILYNAFLSGIEGILIAVSGTGNVIKGNVLPPQPPEDSAVGIAFGQDGNFYGDNLMSATVPFALGGTVQIDLGGNVAF